MDVHVIKLRKSIYMGHYTKNASVDSLYHISFLVVSAQTSRYRRLRDIPLRAIPRALAVQVSGPAPLESEVNAHICIDTSKSTCMHIYIYIYRHFYVHISVYRHLVYVYMYIYIYRCY